MNKREPRAGTELGDSQAVVETTEKKRPPRRPMSKGGTLDIPDHLLEPGYYYYWGLDQPGEIEKLQAAYYEFVFDEKGQKITKSGGHGLTHYLMRLEQQYRDEDKLRQRNEIKRKIEGETRLGSDEYTNGTGGRPGEGEALRRTIT